MDKPQVPETPSAPAILAPNAIAGHSSASKMLPVVRYSEGGKPLDWQPERVPARPNPDKMALPPNHGALKDSPVMPTGYRRLMAEALQRNGVTLDRIAAKLAEKLDANYSEVYTYQGEITDIAEFVDHSTQLEAVRLTGAFLGLSDRQPDTGVNVGSINITWNSSTPPTWTQPPIDVPSASSDASVGVDSVASADATPTPILSQIEGTGIGPRRMNSHPLDRSSESQTSHPLGQLDQSQTPTAHPLGQSGESQTPSTLSERVEKPRLRSGPRLPVNGKRYGARGRRG